MQWCLKQEQASREQNQKHSKELEERLRQQIAKLSQTLDKANEESRLKLAAERGLRMQLNQELDEKESRTAELNRQLQETRKILESVKRQHEQFRHQLLLATGLNEGSKVSVKRRKLFTLSTILSHILDETFPVALILGKPLARSNETLF